MKPVIIHDEAKAEIRSALEKYALIRAELAADFRRVLDSALERIQSNPRSMRRNRAANDTACSVDSHTHSFTLNSTNRSGCPRLPIKVLSAVLAGIVDRMSDIDPTFLLRVQKAAPDWVV